MDRAQDFLKSSRPAQTQPSCMHFKPSSSITRCSHCILTQQVKKLQLHHVPLRQPLKVAPVNGRLILSWLCWLSKCLMELVLAGWECLPKLLLPRSDACTAFRDCPGPPEAWREPQCCCGEPKYVELVCP